MKGNNNLDKTVQCPCGHKMQPLCARVEKGSYLPDKAKPYWAYYCCDCGWLSPQRYGATKNEAIESAYIAATRRPQNRPQIVCLCGPLRFMDMFRETDYALEMQGAIVVGPSFVPGALVHDGNTGCTPEQKIALDALHKRKIDICDAVLVLNRGGYIGESTKSEIDYAKAHDKPVFYWDGTEELMWPTIAEVEAVRRAQQGERLGKGTPVPKAQLAGRRHE